MLPPSQDIARRRPIWNALSELFLDMELDESDHCRIADALADSGYTDEELAKILYGEVFPVCFTNLRSVAGVWAGFDGDRLQDRILANERKFWTRWRIFQPDRRLIQNEWRVVIGLVRERRNGGG